jgi:hypothetical protein
MNNDKQINDLNKIIDSYKIKIYEQKIMIDQLKNKLYYEEMIKKSYLHDLRIKSKL